MKPIIPINHEDITESLLQLKKTGEKISSLNLSEKNPALDLAKCISLLPIIFYPWGLQAAAIRFKSSLQENAKIQAIIEDVLEASHNGIVPLQIPNSGLPILIQGKDDHPKTKERFKIFKDYFEENLIDYKEVFSVEGGILSKIINLIYVFRLFFDISRCFIGN